MPQPVWTWAIIGLILLSIELLSGTFFILWFGVSALGVALLLVLYPALPLPWQLLAFSLLSLTTLAVWRVRYRKQGTGPRVGQSRDDTIGKVGRLTTGVSPAQPGTIVFPVAVMGSRTWTVVSDDTLPPGENAEVTGIEGNFLRIQRASLHEENDT